MFFLDVFFARFDLWVEMVLQGYIPMDTPPYCKPHMYMYTAGGI